MEPNKFSDPVEDWSKVREANADSNTVTNLNPNQIPKTASSSFYLKVLLFLIIIIVSLLVFKYAESKRSHNDVQAGELVGTETVQEMDADMHAENDDRINSETSRQQTSDRVLSAARSASTYRTVSLIMAGKNFTAEISDTAELRELGLSNRASIASDAAMIFVFPQDGRNMFWMKDMNFNIDMIWLDSSKKVVYIAERATPESYPQTFGPLTPSRYVIEVKSGIASKIGLKVGDTVSF